MAVRWSGGKDEQKERMSRIRRRLQKPPGLQEQAAKEGESSAENSEEEVVEMISLDEETESAEKEADGKNENAEILYQSLMERYRRLKERLDAALPWRSKYEDLLNSCLQTITDLDGALEIMDRRGGETIEEGLESSQDSDNSVVFIERIAEGVHSVRDKLLDALQKEDEIMRIEPLLGDPIDPAQHEVVDCIDGEDLPDGTIGEVIEFGYSRAGATIRPARVRVVKSR